MDKGIQTTSCPEIIDLLADLVVFNHYDFQQFLKKLIKIASEVVPVDSCLIYFNDKDKKQLTLVASKKPHADELGHISMSVGEGITGWVVAHEQPVAIKEKAYLDKRFKPFAQLPEDTYESFLSVPILDGKGVVGVINFQNKKAYSFDDEQIKVIESIGKIISSAFTQIILTRKVSSLEEKLEERKIVERAKGILMQAKNISEDEAFKFIRSEAMNKRKSLKEIAEAVLLIWT